MLKEINDTNFNELKEGESIIIVDFWAPWCGPCRIMGGLMEELEARFHDSDINFYKMNVDDNPVTAGNYNIRAIPTILILRNGEIFEQITGLVPVKEISDKIEQAIKTSV